jgi:hypothetical protein
LTSAALKSVEPSTLAIKAKRILVFKFGVQHNRRDTGKLKFPKPTMSNERSDSMRRRTFLKLSAATVGGLGTAGQLNEAAEAAASEPGEPGSAGVRAFNTTYRGAFLNQVAFPLGGIGAGMICLEGTGALSNVSLRNHPEVFNEPCIFAAISIKGHPGLARVLEGPVPARKIFGPPGTGNGAGGTTYGLPRFAHANFQTRFPFGVVGLADPQLPLQVVITGWSPFEPGDPDNASLPVAALENHFINRSDSAVDAVFSFNAKNFMQIGENPHAVRPVEKGFILWGAGPKDQPWQEGALSASVSEPDAKVNLAWFRGGWWDPLTMAWKDVAEAACYDRPALTEGDSSPGASLFVPFQLAAGATRTVVLRLAWYVGRTNLRIGRDPAGAASEPAGSFRPWYGGRFSDINSVSFYWRDNYDE